MNMDKIYKELLERAWVEVEGESTDIRQALIAGMEEIFQRFAEKIVEHFKES